jgi:hypothetical protein
MNNWIVHGTWYALLINDMFVIWVYEWWHKRVKW